MSHAQRGNRGRGAPSIGREPGRQDDLDWGLEDMDRGIDPGRQRAEASGQDELHAAGPQEVAGRRPRQNGPDPQEISGPDRFQRDVDWDFAEELQRQPSPGPPLRGRGQVRAERRAPQADQREHRQGRPQGPGIQHGADADQGRFSGPDLANAEVRAVVAFLNGTFRIPNLDPDSPDLWVENVRDALYSSGMAAVFLAADCRIKLDVPVRLRNEVDSIESWKLAFAWTALRRSLNGVPTIFARSQRCRFADVESLVRSVLDVIQKRSQGIESRLREECNAANMADYPSLLSYVADLETKFNKLRPMESG